jgi:hypothetical protein
LSRRRLGAALAVTVAAMAALVLSPFDFGARNGARWLSPGPGLRLDPAAIAYTREPLRSRAGGALEAVSVELWIEEARGAHNWGQRKIVSLFDGASAPALLVGWHGGLVFLFLRDELSNLETWAFQLRARREVERDRPVFVAAVYGDGEKALFVDGEQVRRREARTRAGGPPALAGRLVVGSESNGLRSFIGRLYGLAVYERALGAAEVRAHGARAASGGVASLRGESGLLALYAFDEGEGGIARSLVPDSPPLVIPKRFAPPLAALLRGHDGRGWPSQWPDARRNVAFFVPLGILLGLLVGPRHPGRLLAAWLAAAGLSLAFEVGQHWLPSRHSSGVDWACNAAGAAIGVWLSRPLDARRRRRAGAGSAG